MKVAGFHHKNLATLFCSNMHFGCRIFWWMLPTFIKKYVRCWQGCCHVVFFLMDVGHLHQKNTLSVDKDVVIAHFFDECRPLSSKKVVIFKGRDFDVHMFVFLSRSIIFLMMIQLPDFIQRLSVGTWVSCFLCSMFFLALPGCSVQALWDSGPNL